jgi:hypothetical protein
MVSLNYDVQDASICGDLAKEIVEEINAYASEATKPSSFRFHMTISLGGAVVILATLLCRDLSVIGLESCQQTYAESFRVGVALLRDLALNLHAARRLLEDLRDIIKVVELVLSNERPDVGHRGDMISAVPPGIDNLFPYSAIYCGTDTQFQNSDSIYHESPGMVGSLTNGSVEQDTLMASWDSWDNELLNVHGGPGIPWI